MERTDYKQILILIGTAGAVYAGFRYLLPLVVPFLFSYLIAIWVYPAVSYLKRKWRLPRGLSGALMMAALVGLLGVGVFFMGKTLLGQVRNVAANMPGYQAAVMEEARQVCSRCDGILGIQAGNTFQFVSQNMEEGIGRWKEEMTPLFSPDAMDGIGKVFGAFWIVFIVLMGAFFIVKDMEDLKIIVQESAFYDLGRRLFGNIGQVGTAYLKAQLIIMASSAVLCSGGLFLMGIPNSLLVGVGISIFDALPVLGSGLLLIPWALFSVIKGNWYHGAMLFTIYLACQLIRETVEAKILGEKIGIKPVFTIISMYAGVELFGVAGFILGPIGFLIIKNFVQSQY